MKPSMTNTTNNKNKDDGLFEPVSPELWQSALRFALDCEDAAARCSRRGCRAERLCQLHWKAGRALDCGGGVSNESVQLAARLALFGWMLAPGA